jgi:hypothetical protein
MEKLEKTEGKFKFSSRPVKKKEEKKETENFSIEELQKYYSEFSEKVVQIENLLKSGNESYEYLLNEEGKKERLEEINSQLKILKEDFKNNCLFLNGYDKQNYSMILDNLTNSFNELKDKMFPRKAFSFSIKNKNITIPIQIADENKEKENLISSSNTSITNESDFVIKDKININISISEEEVLGKNNLIIENLKDSTIEINFTFKACYIKNISNCEIRIGAVAGGSHITNVEGSTIFLSTHQLRIHKTYKTIFKVIVTSNPIIEDCNGLIFSPLDWKGDEKWENNLKVFNIK